MKYCHIKFGSKIPRSCCIINKIIKRINQTIIKNTPSNLLSNDIFQKEPATNFHEKIIDVCNANLQNHIATDEIECVSINQIYEELNHYLNKKFKSLSNNIVNANANDSINKKQ